MKQCLIKTKPKHYIQSVRIFQRKLFKKSNFRNSLNPLKKIYIYISLAAVFLLCDLSTAQMTAVSHLLPSLQSGFRCKV